MSRYSLVRISVASATRAPEWQQMSDEEYVVFANAVIVSATLQFVLLHKATDFRCKPLLIVPAKAGLMHQFDHNV